MARDSNAEERITSLDGTQLAFSGDIVEVVGNPTQVEDVTEYADYGIEEIGWYLFARIKPLTTANNMHSIARINQGRTSMMGTQRVAVTVDDAEGYIIGPNYVDVAVKFADKAQSRQITIHWGPTVDTIIFRAVDLAIGSAGGLSPEDKQDIAELIVPDTVTLDAPTAITLADNTDYYLTDVSDLTISYPSGDFTCWLHVVMAASGTVAVSLPSSTYVGTMPSFGVGETWEVSIRNGTVIAGLVVAEG